ncbi:hypothetical protein E1B28_004803 [Marasmius oreades]|uniref:Uncharacterized protein n=1 Tax=Marasmius oreades TaxID=181124 RepID=A0A9P7UZF7_9AGAR|nr:uncharacterized protein E1B28_004803 [Marasmius oreades]KAG7097459.1 hypothetical protein E1B28_004803 [Marasmius oreades]
MSILPSAVPVVNLESGSSEAQAASLSQLQSEESSYRSICDTALRGIEQALKREDLDPNVRDKLTPLFSSIKEQKNNLISIISKAQEVEELITSDDDTIEPSAYRQETQSLLEKFTKATGELSLEIGSLGELIAEHDIPV